MCFLNFDEKNFFSPIRLHDIGPWVTTYLYVQKKVVSISKNRSPPPIGKKQPKKLQILYSMVLNFFKSSNFLSSCSKLTEVYDVQKNSEK
jgi:hypothetical protein